MPNGIVLNSSGLVRDVVVVGASAGGIPAVSRMFRGMPDGLQVIKALVMHRSPYASPNLASVLERLSGQRVIEPASGQHMPPCIVHLAPADMHLTLTPTHAVVSRSVREHSTRPAVDPLFRSAAAAYGPRVVGVLLTGAGDDGVLGLMRIKAAGGIAIVQSPEEAEYASMPTNALRYDLVDAALRLDMIGPVLEELAQGKRIEIPRSAPRGNRAEDGPSRDR
jgi:two-component system, chemotaxis family, protein-glutamate methylesterase/glutaminase